MSALEFFQALEQGMGEEIRGLTLNEDEWVKLEARVSNTGYQETLGMDTVTFFSKAKEQFIPVCTTKILPASVNVIRGCGDYAQSTLVPSIFYPTCITAHFKQQPLNDAYETGLRPVGFQLIAFVGHFNETLHHYWACGDDIRQMVKGIRFAIHEPDSRDVMLDKPLLSPGFMHQIDVKTTVRKRIKRTKSDGSLTCVDDGDTYYDVYHGTTVSYQKVRNFITCLYLHVKYTLRLIAGRL